MYKGKECPYTFLRLVFLNRLVYCVLAKILVFCAVIINKDKVNSPSPHCLHYLIFAMVKIRFNLILISSNYFNEKDNFISF